MPRTQLRMPVEPAPAPRSLKRRVGIILGGSVFALAIIGQIIFLTRSIGSGALTSGSAVVKVPRTGSLVHRLDVVLANALGTSDRGVKRFRVAAVQPAAHHRAAVSITWAINSDISSGTVGNGAQQDAYVMLRDLYTSGLPIASARMSGTYPLGSHNRETVVMRLAMTRQEAATAAQAGWDNLDAESFWPLIDRIYVNPQFQPLAPE